MGEPKDVDVAIEGSEQAPGVVAEQSIGTQVSSKFLNDSRWGEINPLAKAKVENDRLEDIRLRKLKPALEVTELHEKVEESVQELMRLKTTLRNLCSEIAQYMPKEMIGGIEGRDRVLWSDIERWNNEGILYDFFHKLSKDLYPDDELAQQEFPRMIHDKLEFMFILNKEIQELAGSAARPKDEQTIAQEIASGVPEDKLIKWIPAQRDEKQRNIDIFHNFRLKEMAFARAKIGQLTQNIELLQKLAANDSQRGWHEQARKRELERQDLIELRNQEILRTPEAYYDFFGGQLLEARRVFDQDGKIFDTEYVKTVKSQFHSALDKGQAVFVFGETGTGKTEICKAVILERTGHQARVISGRRGMDISEMTEGQDIRPTQKDEPEITTQQIENRISELIKGGFVDEIVDIRVANEQEAGNLNDDQQTVDKFKEEESKRLLTELREDFKLRNKDRLKITARLQPIYDAAKNGYGVIIDEMDAIPHHTLIALNEILTKKPCPEELYLKYQRREIGLEEIDDRYKFRSIYGEAEIVIHPKFIITATANWKPEGSEDYQGRQVLDTAFLRRWKLMHYDYLPNVVSGDLFTKEMSPEEERQIKAESELYQMISARVLNPDLTARLPRNTFERLDALARCARIIQDIFSERNVEDRFWAEDMSGNGSTKPPSDVLKQNVLDLGKLIEFIITPWMKEGFRYKIDSYIASEYLSRSEASEEEFMLLYKIFQRNDFFKPEEGWPAFTVLSKTPAVANADPDMPIDTNALKLNGKDAILRISETVLAEKKHPKNLKLEIPEDGLYDFSPVTIIEKIYGRGPERTLYPDFTATNSTEGEVDAVDQAFAVSDSELYTKRGVEAATEKLIAYFREFIDKTQSTRDRLSDLINQLPGSEDVLKNQPTTSAEELLKLAEDLLRRSQDNEISIEESERLFNEINAASKKATSGSN